MSGDRPPATGWAVVIPAHLTSTRRPSVVVEIGDDVDEHRAWTVALGWPTRGEVKHAKANGARAYRCRLVEITDVD